MSTEKRADLKINMETSPELYQEQIRLEQRSYELGREKLTRNIQQSVEAGQEHNTSYGSRFIGLMISEVKEGLEQLHDQHNAKAKGGRPTVHQQADAAVQEAGAHESAMIALQHVMASISTPTSYTQLAIQIGTGIEKEIYLASLKEEDDKLLKKIDKRIAEKNDPKLKWDSAIRLARFADIEREPWSEERKMKLGQYMLEVIRQLRPNLFKIEDIAKPGNNGKTKNVRHIVATEDTLSKIQENISSLVALSPVREPMCVPPVDWKPGMAHGGGYLTGYNRPLRLVKTRDRNYLEELKSAYMPEVLKALNAAQRTAWRIRPEVIELHKQLKKIGRRVENSKMPFHTDMEIPEKPDWVAEHSKQRKAMYQWEQDKKKNPFTDQPKPPVSPEYEKREVLFKRFRKQKAVAFDENLSRQGQRVNYHLILSTAEVFSQYDAIYFPHQLDFRGRLYAVPNLNPQSADWIKGLLEFSEGKRLGSEGLWWWKVHVANLFGVDKVSFPERVQWTEDNWEQLKACAQDPIEHRFWEDADKPFQAYGAALELLGIEEHGVDFESHMPIDLDGSCSGLQNLGMALRCEVTGESVNLTEQEEPADIYDEVKEKIVGRMEELVGDCETRQQAREAAVAEAKKTYFTEVKGADSKKWPKVLNDLTSGERLSASLKSVKQTYNFVVSCWEWLQFGVTRKHCKRSVMTFPYGSKEYGFRQQIMYDTLDPLKKSLDEKFEMGYITEAQYDEEFPFSNDGYYAAGALAKLLFQYVTETVLKAAEIMEWMQSTAKLVASQQRPVRWTTNLGFPVMQAYRKTEMRRINTRLFGNRMQLSIREEQEAMDTVRSGNAISPNVTHSLDSSHLLKLVSMAVDEGMGDFALIHDSFGTHAADTGRFFQIIREAFVELYREPYFEKLAQEFKAQLEPELRDEIPPLPSYGNLDIESVLRSKYAFA